jgi:hypothetical protein
MSEKDSEETQKAKYRIRGIMASLKQRKKIEGNAKNGFWVVESNSKNIPRFSDPDKIGGENK